MTTDPARRDAQDEERAPSGLRRLIMVLLFPDVLAWGWMITVVVLVSSRDDARLGSGAAAVLVFAVAALASAGIGYSMVAVGREDADDTNLKTPAIVAAVASAVLWLSAFWLSFIAEIAV